MLTLQLSQLLPQILPVVPPNFCLVPSNNTKSLLMISKSAEQLFHTSDCMKLNKEQVKCTFEKAGPTFMNGTPFAMHLRIRT